MNFITAGGFMPPELGPTGLRLAPSGQLFQRSIPGGAELAQEIAALERGETTPDFGATLAQLQSTLVGLSRGITSGMTAFPVRENLEAETAVLVPVTTPARNMLPRVPGAGTAVAWKQVTSLGGGWGTSLDQPGGGSANRRFSSENRVRLRN